MQNWNNILDYVKLNLGAKLNFLEMSDDEIIRNIKTQIIPEFSQFSPHKKETIIDGYRDIIRDLKPGENRFTYKIPSEDDEYIIDVLELYYGETYHSDYDDPYYGTKYSQSRSNPVPHGHSGSGFFGMIDTVIGNRVNDMQKYLRTRNTWEFRPPNLILTDLGIESATIVYNVPHKTLKTINPDVYHSAFKPYCLGNVQLWISNLRQKYGELTTPFGNIKLNWEKLEQDAKENIEKAKDILNRLPLDHFVYVSV